MKVIYSQDQNRTNELSVQPGGSIVTVHLIDGTIIHYDKIKNVQRYVRAIDKSRVSKITCNTETLYQK